MRTTKRLSTMAFALVLLAAAPSRARGDEATTGAAPANADAAQEHYTAGRESYRLGLYGRALEQFERSLALAPSPNTRLYIARTLRELGRWSEAADQYTATIREAGGRGGRYLATRDAANVELGDVKVRLERATAGPRVEGAEKADKSETGHVDEGAAASKDVPRAPATTGFPSRGGPSTLTWISGGIAVAGTASFAVLYALASNRFGYLEGSCARVRTGACDDARTTGKAEEIGAYASLGVAAVAAVVTVYSLVVAPSTSGGSAKPTGRESWRIAF
jgi:tetratricopeptide (TPR) repeat protein